MPILSRHRPTDRLVEAFATLLRSDWFVRRCVNGPVARGARKDLGEWCFLHSGLICTQPTLPWQSWSFTHEPPELGRHHRKYHTKPPTQETQEHRDRLLEFLYAHRTAMLNGLGLEGND